MAQYKEQYNKGGIVYEVTLEVIANGDWNICSTPLSGPNQGATICSILDTDGNTTTVQDFLDRLPAGNDGTDGRGIVGNPVLTSTVGLVDTYTITYTDNTHSTFTVTNGSSGGGSAVTKVEEYINDILLRAGYPKKLIIVADSIWDKSSYNINSIILSTCQQLGIESVFMCVQASMSSTEWVNGDFPATSLQTAIDACVGVDGEDTLVMMSLGINDIDFEDILYDWNTHFASQKVVLKANVDLLLASKPKIKMWWTTAPASGGQTVDNSFNELFERMISEIAEEQGVPWYSSYEGLKGVRPAYQNSNQSSAFYNDLIHPNEIGLMRLWYYLLMKIVPSFYYKNIDLTEFAVPVASPNDQPSFAVIQGSAYTNTVVNNQLTLTSTANHYRFTQYATIPGQLIALKMPDISLMGTFAMEVKWVMKTGNELYDGEPIDLPPLPVGRDFYLLNSPNNVAFLCVNISNDNAFWTAYQADNSICYLKMAYSRTTYNADIEDIMMGFPNLLNY